MFSSTAICPAEIVKCRLQAALNAAGGSSASRPKVSPVSVVLDVYRRDGLLGYFRGLPSLWLRDIPFNFIFLGSYETLCAGFVALGRKSKSELNPGELVLAGGLAGMTAWGCVFPVDVIKSRTQVAQAGASGGVFQVIRHVYRTEGARAFYRGCSAAILRAFPANAALLLGFEMSHRFLHRLDVERADD